MLLTHFEGVPALNFKKVQNKDHPSNDAFIRAEKQGGYLTAKLYDNNPVKFRTFFPDITDVTVSIQFVRNEVPNEVVINTLKPYGKIKGDLIRLQNTSKICGKKFASQKLTIRMIMV